MAQILDLYPSRHVPDMCQIFTRPWTIGSYGGKEPMWSGQPARCDDDDDDA